MTENSPVGVGVSGAPIATLIGARCPAHGLVSNGELAPREIDSSVDGDGGANRSGAARTQPSSLFPSAGLRTASQSPFRKATARVCGEPNSVRPPTRARTAALGRSAQSHPGAGRHASGELADALEGRFGWAGRRRSRARRRLVRLRPSLETVAAAEWRRRPAAAPDEGSRGARLAQLHVCDARVGVRALFREEPCPGVVSDAERPGARGCARRSPMKSTF